MSEALDREILVGRQGELRGLHEAIRKRESVLIWGPADSGKTALVKLALDELPEDVRRQCFYLESPSSPQGLLQQAVARMYAAGDPHVCGKLRADGGEEGRFDRWIRWQSSLRLRGIAYRAAEQSRYWLFLDHLPPLSHAMARLVKEFIWRCKAPVYLVARGFQRQEIGYAWSLYWTDRYRIGLEPLPEAAARELLHMCVKRFGLLSLELADFREDVLRLSGLLPGAIVKMCALAAQPRYQYGRQIKTRLVHVDYLMSARLDRAQTGQTVGA